MAGLPEDRDFLRGPGDDCAQKKNGRSLTLRPGQGLKQSLVFSKTLNPLLPVRQLHVVEPSGIGGRAGICVHLEGHIQFL